MQKMLRFAIILLLSITTVSAFASGGACPSGTPVAGNNCYFVAANGSDSNAGTSESSPWQHAPGMPACTGTCASVTPAPGMGFIFRGGDTWHFGNSGATPYTGGPWGSSSYSGTSSSPIYIGVDQSWFSASSWTRPILSGDNPLTPHPGTLGDSVSSCAYQVGGNNQMLGWYGGQWVILDNFEFTGLCQSDPNGPQWQRDAYIIENCTNCTYEHLYFHGWTHVPWSSSVQLSLFAIYGGNQPDHNLQIVVDGSDSDPGGAGAMFEGGYDVSQSVFRYNANVVLTYLHSIHDNLFEHWFQPSDNASHGNVLETSGEFGGDNAVYGNVFRYLGTDCGSCAFENIDINPSKGYTDYFFNNIVYQTGSGINGNYFDAAGLNQTTGTYNAFNNVFENTTNGTIITCWTGGGWAGLILSNNRYITDGGAYAYPVCSTTTKTELTQSHATAISQGLTATSTFAWMPTSGNAAAGSSGTNLTSMYCASMQGSGDSLLQAAGNACASDTTYAVSYNSSNHTVSAPARKPLARPASAAWDIGAYQQGQGQSPDSPTGLKATLQ
jgi:hypothetical protein